MIPSESIPPKFAESQAAYVREMNRPLSRIVRLTSRALPHLSEHFPWPLVLIVILTGLTIGLCL